MGRTYQKNYKRYDDDFDSGRSGKQRKHANGKTTGGMRTLNNYDDYDDATYESYDDDYYEELDSKQK